MNIAVAPIFVGVVAAGSHLTMTEKCLPSLVPLHICPPRYVIFRPPAGYLLRSSSVMVCWASLPLPAQPFVDHETYPASVEGLFASKEGSVHDDIGS